MQDLDWDDLKIALALHRGGSLAAAGRLLAHDATTVARRLARLERALGAAVFLRDGPGRYRQSALGAAIVAHAERVERETLAMRDTVGMHRGALQGVVRITSVPILVNRFLVPRLPAFLAANPGIAVELVPDARALSLGQREADLALRFARPATGGLAHKARRLGTLPFAIYAAAGLDRHQHATLPWIGYDDPRAHLPQARWLAAASADRGGRAAAGLTVADAETALEAAACGLGKTLLPALVADEDPRLRRLDPPADSDPPQRDVWLLSVAAPEARAAVARAKGLIVALDWPRPAP